MKENSIIVVFDDLMSLVPEHKRMEYMKNLKEVEIE